MFSIIISEKGGPERRESFDKSEVTIGRVQGNDLLLVKGNVSKHHARFLFRDGRFIVTDLKSTNGTYINGRKIAQATIVREGDKIYIGDFVLRLEAAQSADVAAKLGASSEDDSVRTLAKDVGVVANRPSIVKGTVGMATPFAAPAQVLAGASAPPVRLSELPEAATSAPAPNVRPVLDEESSTLHRVSKSVQPVGPLRPSTLPFGSMGAPALPRPAAASSHEVLPEARSTDDSGAFGEASLSSAKEVGAAARSSPPVVTALGLPAPASSSGEPVEPDSVVFVPRVKRLQTASELEPVRAVMAQVREKVDLELASVEELSHGSAAWNQRVADLSRARAQEICASGDGSSRVTAEAIAEAVAREICRLGPLGALVEAPSVSRIEVFGPDHVLVSRHVGGATREPVAISSAHALVGMIDQLAVASGEPRGKEEFALRRRLPFGTMDAVLPPICVHPALVIQKTRRWDDTLEEFVRHGAITAAAATVLDAVVVGGLSVLVVGPAPEPLVAALACALPLSASTVVCADATAVPRLGGEAAFFEPTEEAARAVAALCPRAVVVPEARERSLAWMIDACAVDVAMLVGVAAPTAIRAIGHLAAQVVRNHRISLDSAMSMVCQRFDIVVEVGLTADAGFVVRRIAEPAGANDGVVSLRDLFATDANCKLRAVGVVPKFAEALASRGVTLSANLFR